MDRDTPLKRRFLTILITGVGAPGTFGTKEALKQLPFPYRLVGVDIDPLVANNFLFDEFYIVPKPGSAEFVSELLDMVARENISLILPQVEDELMLLAVNKNLFARLGCQVLVNDADQIKILNNKYKLMQSVEWLGLNVPEHYLVKTRSDLRRAASRLGYPKEKVAVKPPVSSGMRGLRILTDSHDRVFDFLHKKPGAAECSLEDFLAIFPSAKIPDLLVSEYLLGPEFSVDCLCRDGEPVLILPRTRDKIKSGITFVGTSTQEKGIIAQCARVIEGLSLNHMIGFQFRCGEHGRPMILECNPRVQGTMVLGAFCGANVIAGAVCQALGIPFKAAQNDIEWGVTLSRYWGGIIHKGDSLIRRI